ncbi:hypothetical protein PVAG01_04877 [Phlyctema vagabunda]|uniref:Uncharacterized protein n=1 Tax=Phlyctema vagabunda TaxID=108571 RepID=A0ABR4PIK6_9HELO
MNDRGRIETPFEAILNLEYFPFLRASGGTFEKKRVGTPPLLSLPLCNVQFDAEDPNLYLFNAMQPEIESTLKRQGVQVHSIELCGRKVNAFNSSLFDRLPTSAMSKTEDLDITILVIACWEEYSYLVWPNCVNQIRKMVIDEGCPYIKVEMLDKTLSSARYMSEVKASHPFVSIWTGHLQDEITYLINQCPTLKHMWRSIDVMHLGPHEFQDFNSTWLPGCRSVSSLNPIVISVTVDRSLHEFEWQPAEKRIREILDSKGLAEIQIEFERGVVEHFRASLDNLQTDVYLNHQLPLISTTDNSLRPGMSFSGTTPNIDENGKVLPTSIGTTGPILQLLNKSTKIPIANVLLTSYHAVRPWIPGWRKEVNRERMPAEHGTACDDIDLHGFSNFDAPTKSKLSVPPFASPSPRLINMAMQRHSKDSCAVLEALNLDMPPKSRQDLERLSAELQRQLKWLAENSKIYIGSIMFASGMKRRRNKVCIDYALIGLQNSRTYFNDIPPTSAAPLDAYSTLRGPKEFPATSELLYKHGAMSSTTQGFRSPMRSNVSPTGSRSRSKEHAVFGQDNEFFAKQGDSGAPVFTRRGHWVGIVTGGVYKLHVTQPLVYVTPAELILEDITEKTGFEVRIFNPAQ